MCFLIKKLLVHVMEHINDGEMFMSYWWCTWRHTMTNLFIRRFNECIIGASSTLCDVCSLKIAGLLLVVDFSFFLFSLEVEIHEYPLSLLFVNFNPQFFYFIRISFMIVLLFLVFPFNYKLLYILFFILVFILLSVYFVFISFIVFSF